MQPFPDPFHGIFASIIKYGSFIKYSVQCTQQGIVLIKCVATLSQIFIVGENDIEIAFLVLAPDNQIKEDPAVFLF